MLEDRVFMADSRGEKTLSISLETARAIAHLRYAAAKLAREPEESRRSDAIMADLRVALDRCKALGV